MTVAAMSGKSSLSDTQTYLSDLFPFGTAGSIIFARSTSRGGLTRHAIVSATDIAGAARSIDSYTGVDLYLKFNSFIGNAIVARSNGAVGAGRELAVVNSIAFDIDCHSKNPKYLSQQEMLTLLETAMPVQPSMIVGSDGKHGGLHVYYCLTEPIYIGVSHSIGDLNTISKRLLAKLKDLVGDRGAIDRTYDVSRVLRPVGAKRASGNRVCVIKRYVDGNGDLARRSLAELTLPPTAAELASLQRTANIQTNSSTLLTDYLASLGITTIEDALMQAGWYDAGKDIWTRPGAATSAKSGEISRSNKTGEIGITIRTAGEIQDRFGKPHYAVDWPQPWLSPLRFWLIYNYGGLAQQHYEAAAKDAKEHLLGRDDFRAIQVAGNKDREAFFRSANQVKLPLANYYVDSKMQRALDLEKIEQVIEQHWGAYPKAMNGVLITPDKTRGANIHKNQASLFAALYRSFSVDFKATGITKSELFESYLSRGEQVEDLECSPHFPAIERVEYTHDSIGFGDGSELDNWMSLWNPTTPSDRELILALLATVFWGGPAGKRPFFLVVAEGDNKVGAGKSTLAEAVARAANKGRPGHYSYPGKREEERFIQQLLSPTAESKRVVLYDNIKSYVVGGQFIESLVTSEAISGKRMYVGDGTRPNYLTWIGTGNNTMLSDDLSSRCYVISLDAAKYGGDFERRLLGVDYSALAADVGSFFLRPQQTLKQYSRFGAWDDAIRSRLNSPDFILAQNRNRAQRYNDDVERADQIRDQIVDSLKLSNINPDSAVVVLPNRWLVNCVSGSELDIRPTAKAVNRELRQLGVKIAELTESNTRAYGPRGWIWRGLNSVSSSAVDTSLV